MLHQLNTVVDATQLSVHDRLFGRQANNLLASSLPEAVRPWYEDMMDADVDQAIDSLADPRRRSDAANFLGLDLIRVA